MKRKDKIRKKLALVFSGVYVMWAVLFGVQMVGATETSAQVDPTVTIMIDGDISDWKAMDSLAVADGSVSEWRLAKSADGTKLYLCYNGVAKTEWDSTYMWDSVQITYPNGTSLNSQIATIKDTWIAPGAEVASSSNASGNNAGDYVVECVLPVTENGYTITFAGTTIAEADIPTFVPAEEVEPVYSGIVIDGKFDDWDAVTHVEAECPNEQHNYECLKSAACVFDGDYVYFYLQDGESGIAAGAGLGSNGRYSITTDMGRQLVFQLTTANGGSVTGVEGAKVAYYGDEWEVAVPVSRLPVWKESISFGLYQSEPFFTNIMNIQGSNEAVGPAGEFTGIVYDGLYGDWDAYPHTLIQYATAGTQTDKPDGEGALYHDGSILYGHVVSSMDVHLEQMGGEFDSAISICFNGNREFNGDKTWNLYPRLVAVADDGTIDWEPQTGDLPKGSYEFYIADIRGEYNTLNQTNLADLAEHEQFFGKMTITVGDTNDETEFYIDLEQVAEFLSYYSNKTIEAGDFKLIEAQFGEIGSDYLSIAGASAAPYMGIAIAMAVSGGVLWKRRRNKVVK